MSTMTTSASSSSPSLPSSFMASSSSFDVDSFIKNFMCAFTGQQEDISNNNYEPPNSSSFWTSFAPKPEVPSAASTSNEVLTQATATIELSKTAESAVYIEQVRVESSAHVSFIVGKQGSKIRKIRTETEAHIQTPVNGEEPIFVLKGRKRNVQQAKERILLEAHNYSMLLYNQARSYKDGERRQVNIYLPARFIGLVVGKKGASIKRIMEQTGADIVTPKVNTINGFKLFGNGGQIREAIDQIKYHILSSNNVTIEEETNMFEVTLRITSNK